MQARKNASSKDDLEEQKKAKAAVPQKIKGTNSGKDAKKDAELVLYEFIGMLVRISFWRCNPKFGLFVDKDGDGKKDQEEVRRPADETCTCSDSSSRLPLL